MCRPICHNCAIGRFKQLLKPFLQIVPYIDYRRTENLYNISAQIAKKTFVS